MIYFEIVSLFPQVFKDYFNQSIIERAQENKLIKITVYNLRDYTKDKYKKVDDRPYGGGPGMVIKVEPLTRAITAILATKPKIKKNKTKIVLFSPAGRQFDNEIARNLAINYQRIILICGRYEGIDQRIEKVIRDLGYKIQEISIGPYVLSGGEIPAMVLVDCVCRHIKGALGKFQSLEEERLGVGVPVYTHPEVFIWKGKKYRVPKILLSGHHQKIEEWRKKHRRVVKS